jgi:hypothetical protein
MLSRFEWTFHNVIGHPVAEILHILGATRWGEWFHDITIPKGHRFPGGSWADQKESEND